MSDQIRNNVFESVELYPSALQHLYSFLYWSRELKDTVCRCDKPKQKYYQPMGERQSAKLEKVKPYCITKRQKCQCFSDRSFMCPQFEKRIGRNITA